MKRGNAGAKIGCTGHRWLSKENDVALQFTIMPLGGVTAISFSSVLEVFMVFFWLDSKRWQPGWNSLELNNNCKLKRR